MGLYLDLEELAKDLFESLINQILKPVFLWLVSNPLMAVLMFVLLAWWAQAVFLSKEK